MKILILGYGKTGKELESLLSKENDVYVYDDVILDKENYLSLKKINKELPFFDYVVSLQKVKSINYQVN